MTPLFFMPLFAIFSLSFFFYKNTLGLQASEGALLCVAFFFVRILWAYKLLRVPYCVQLFFYRQIPLAIPQIKDLS